MIVSYVFFLLKRQSPRYKRTDTPFHYTTVFRCVEQLIAVDPERTQRAAAIGTGAAAGLGLDPPFGARQMIGQCAHRRYRLGRYPLGRSVVGDLGLAFELFQGKLAVLDLEPELLPGPAAGHASALGELVPAGRETRYPAGQSALTHGPPR